MHKLNIIIFLILLTSCLSEKNHYPKNSDFSKSGAFISGKRQSGHTENIVLWTPGEKIKIGFTKTDGTLKNREHVKLFSKDWTRYGNIDFEFQEFDSELNKKTDFNVIISFKKNSGSFSNVGKKRPTEMNLDPGMINTKRKARRVVLHEFGHMLGFAHEHKRDDCTVNIDPAKAYAYYGRTNGWSKDTVNSNILFRTGEGRKIGDYDPDSIMHYEIEKEVTTDSVGSKLNTYLSKNDKMAIAIVYPGRVLPADFEAEYKKELAELAAKELAANTFGICRVYKDEKQCNGPDLKYTIKIIANEEVALNDKGKYLCSTVERLRLTMKKDFSVCKLANLDDLRVSGICEIKDKDFVTSTGLSCLKTKNYPLIDIDENFLGCVDSIQEGHKTMLLYPEYCEESDD